MKDMQHYRVISARVTPRASCREEVISMAMEMQKKKNRPVMRKIGITLAAAAVAVGGMTVAVGAANDWDYQSIFTKYFSDKTESTVEYDFSKVGMDINQSAEYAFGTVTVESALITPYAMYLSWDIQLNDTAPTNADDVLFSSIGLSTESGMNSLMVHEVAGTRGDDGAYHFAAILQSGESELTGETYKLWNTSLAKRPSGGGNPTYFQDSLSSTEQDAILFTVSETTEFGLKKLDGALHTEYCDAEYFAVSPLGITFTDAKGADPQKVLEETGNLGWTEATVSKEFAVTAVYADSTEQQLANTCRCIVYYDSNPDLYEMSSFGYRYFLTFDTPLETEGLTAIIINDTEIPF